MFIVNARIPGGKVCRVVLGYWPIVQPEEARKRAQVTLGEIKIGIDPRNAKGRQRVRKKIIQVAKEHAKENAQRELKQESPASDTQANGSEQQTALFSRILKISQEMGELIELAKHLGGNERRIESAKTDFQKGLMSLVSSVGNPEFS